MSLAVGGSPPPPAINLNRSAATAWQQSVTIPEKFLPIEGRLFQDILFKSYKYVRTMLLSTTNTIENRSVTEYLGVVTGETIIGANIFKDIFAGIRDIVGGRSGSYERVLAEARENALDEMAAKAREKGADGVIGIDLDYETLGANGGMIMVTASGTAVRF